MSDLPKGWTSEKLSEIVEINMGQSPPSHTYNQTKEGLPFFQGKAEFGKLYPTVVKFCNQPLKIAHANNVLISVRAPVGSTNLASETCCIGRGLAALTPKDEIPSLYLLYFLRSIENWLSAQGTGSTFTAISKTDLQEIEVPLPPTGEQKRIVEKLEKLLGKVEAVQARLDKIPAILKRFRQAVLAAACSGKLTADWRMENSDKSAEKLKQDIISEFYQKTKKKIDETDFFQKPDNSDIPSSWQWIISANLFHFVTSGSRGWAKYYSDSGTLFIRVGNLDHDSIELDLSSKRFVNPPQNAEGTRTRVFENDILVSITADVGMIGLVKSDIGEAYINQHISLARPVESIDKKFLAYYLTSEDGGQKQFRELQRGATKAGLGLGDIKNIWVALPPIEEQKEIVRRVEDLFKFADQIEARYKKARSYTDKLTQSILAKAFRGELVPQGERDEPASILLERIKAEKAENNSGKAKSKPKQKAANQSRLFE